MKEVSIPNHHSCQPFGSFASDRLHPYDPDRLARPPRGSLRSAGPHGHGTGAVHRLQRIGESIGRGHEGLGNVRTLVRGIGVRRKEGEHDEHTGRCFRGIF